jgi:hypothetical protein
MKRSGRESDHLVPRFTHSVDLYLCSALCAFTARTGTTSCRHFDCLSVLSHRHRQHRRHSPHCVTRPTAFNQSAPSTRLGKGSSVILSAEFPDTRITRTRGVSITAKPEQKPVIRKKLRHWISQTTLYDHSDFLLVSRNWSNLLQNRSAYLEDRVRKMPSMLLGYT